MHRQLTPVWPIRHVVSERLPVIVSALFKKNTINIPRKTTGEPPMVVRTDYEATIRPYEQKSARYQN